MGGGLVGFIPQNTGINTTRSIVWRPGQGRFTARKAEKSYALPQWQRQGTGLEAHLKHTAIQAAEAASSANAASACAEAFARVKGLF
jgi:hypothetical protein